VHKSLCREQEMAVNMYQWKTHKSALYGLLLMLLIIGSAGPVLQTLDDDENLGITFLEVTIHHDVTRADTGGTSHPPTVAALVGNQYFHLNTQFEIGFRNQKLFPLAYTALASLKTPLRR